MHHVPKVKPTTNKNTVFPVKFQESIYSSQLIQEYLAFIFNRYWYIIIPFIYIHCICFNNKYHWLPAHARVFNLNIFNCYQLCRTVHFLPNWYSARSRHLYYTRIWVCQVGVDQIIDVSMIKCNNMKTHKRNMELSFFTTPKSIVVNYLYKTYFLCTKTY